MTAIRCVGSARSAGEAPNLGHRSSAACDPVSDPQLVGRTSAPASGRALVPTTSSPAGDGPVTRRTPSAAFLAHLIATAQQAPQTRVRRRAEPGEVRAVYTAAQAAPAGLGRKVHRSL
jgi:hypothetical protein